MKIFMFCFVTLWMLFNLFFSRLFVFAELMIFWKFLKNFWFLVPWFIRIFWLLIKFDTTRKNNNPKLAGISFLKNIYSIFFPAFFSTSFHNRVCLLNFILFFCLSFFVLYWYRCFPLSQNHRASSTKKFTEANKHWWRSKKPT